VHGCYLDSVSPKYPLYADRAGQLQQRGIARRNALMLIATHTAVPLEKEWVEAFWCNQCQQTTWYHVRKTDDRTYEISIAPPSLWQQVTGVINPEGNPSVSEFTRKQSRMYGCKGIKNFSFL
jgi:hypothetical protein